LTAEVHAIINGCYNRAREIIYANRDKLEMIANALLEYETLDGVQVRGHRAVGKFTAAAANAQSRSAYWRAGRNPAA